MSTKPIESFTLHRIPEVTVESNFGKQDAPSEEASKDPIDFLNL